MPHKTSLTYSDAGVDIDAGNRLVEDIKVLARKTSRPGVLSEPGGFAALFEVPLDRYRRPVLVSGTDGVGTKLKLALEHGRHRGVGVDLVAMCVNDVVVQGAEPLFFLDYFATGRLVPGTAREVVAGIADGCVQAGAALIGGETAELPGMYSGNDYDLAGFCVGVAEFDQLIDGHSVAEGDVLIGLPSSGPHSNGYSLIRKIIALDNADPEQDIDGRPLIDRLLEPTTIYVKPLLALLDPVEISAMAHITGGGLIGNIPRVLPVGMQAHIETSAWQRPAVFDWLQNRGNVENEEMYKTFNCGIGMVIIVRESAVDTTLTLLNAQGQDALVIGRIESGTGVRLE